MDIEPSGEKTYYPSIQVLRGIAALAVVLIHVSDMLLQYTDKQGLFCRLSEVWYTGAAGVDLFFIISGFVMVQSTRNKFQKQGASTRFLARRFVRIIPVYWLYTTFMLVLVLLPFTLKALPFSPAYTLKSYFFIPTLNPVSGLNLPLLPQGWTLSYEMYFYLIFSLLLLFPQKMFLLAISLFFSLSVMTGFFLETTNPALEVVTSPLLLEFVLGCCLAFLLNCRDVTSRTAAILATAGIVLLLLSPLAPPGTEYRLITWGIPMFFVTAGLVFLDKNSSPGFPSLLMHMGNSSYSTYLSHVFVLLVIATLLKKNLLPAFLPNDLLAVIAVILCQLFGYISYISLEKPLSLHFTRKWR